MRPDNHDQRFLSRLSAPLRWPLPDTFVLLALGLPGLVVAGWQRRPGAVLLFGYLALYVASVVPFFVFGRYRAPILPALAVGAGFLIAHLAAVIHRREGRRAAALVGAVAAVAAGLTLLPPVPDHNGALLNNLGTAQERSGHPELALRTYDRAIRADPDDPLAHYNRARSLAAAGRRGEALASYRRSLALHAGLPETHANLGALLLDMQRLQPARAALERALEIDPDLPEARFNLALIAAAQGETAQAVALLRQCAELADSLGRAELAGRARQRGRELEAEGAP